MLIENRSRQLGKPSRLSPEGEFENLIRRCQAGCGAAHNDLARRVHPDFYRIAKRLCAGQGFEHSLHATNLVNETFLRLLKGGVFQKSESSGYLFAAAGRAMRNVIADYLRTKHTKKRSPSGHRVYLDSVIDQLQSQPFQFDDLNESLSRLESEAPRKAQIVNMRFFLGMTVDEIANSLNLSASTVEKEWAQARAWLYRDLKELPLR